MNYKYRIERKALKFIRKQPEDQQRRIYAAIYKLSAPLFAEPKTGTSSLSMGELS